MTNAQISSLLFSIVEGLREKGFILDGVKWEKRRQNNEDYIDFYYYRKGKVYGGGFVESDLDEKFKEKIKDDSIKHLIEIFK